MIKDPRREKELQKLVKKLGLLDTKKVNWSLLDLALIHPSISQTDNYQQLEFVGDAVLRLAAAEVLYHNYHDETVGEFAAIRSILVSDRTLGEFADYYGIEEYLIMKESTAKNRVGRNNRLADAFEAILGALYLSTNSLALINPWFAPILKKKAIEIRLDPTRHNYKDALQSWTQANYKELPIYETKAVSKPENYQNIFISEVWFQKNKLGMGMGNTKKEAEQAAAKEAFLSINQDSFD
jgi:ribonuclease III